MAKNIEVIEQSTNELTLAERQQKKPKKKKNKLKAAWMYTLLGIFLIVSIFPFYWMFIGATNDSSKMFTNPPTLLPGDQFMTNLTNLNESIGIFRVLFNSLFVSGLYVVIALAVCATAAYVLSEIQF